MTLRLPPPPCSEPQTKSATCPRIPSKRVLRPDASSSVSLPTRHILTRQHKQLYSGRPGVGAPVATSNDSHGMLGAVHAGVCWSCDLFQYLWQNTCHRNATMQPETRIRCYPELSSATNDIQATPCYAMPLHAEAGWHRARSPMQPVMVVTTAPGPLPLARLTATQPNPPTAPSYPPNCPSPRDRVARPSTPSSSSPSPPPSLFPSPSPSRHPRHSTTYRETA